MLKRKNAVVNFRTMYEIKRVCGKVYFIVIYFLGNAQTFKGEDAKRLKQELKAAIK